MILDKSRVEYVPMFFLQRFRALHTSLLVYVTMSSRDSKEARALQGHYINLESPLTHLHTRTKTLTHLLKLPGGQSRDVDPLLFFS